MKSRIVTTKEIAIRAGVSRGVVSFVLNGSNGNIRVSEDTRRRVIDAANELGYTPNQAAQSLRRGTSKMIGYVKREIQKTWLEQTVSHLLSTYVTTNAQKRGYNIIEVSPESQTSNQQSLTQILMSHRVDGVIFDWPISHTVVEPFVNNGIPIVQLLRPQYTVATSTVIVDASKGISDAVAHLVHLGHTRIAYIGHGGNHPVDKSRFENFVNSLKNNCLNIYNEYVKLGSSYSLTEGYEFTLDLLKLKNPPTAIFTSSDIHALGTLRALYHEHINVPNDISVISYDDMLGNLLYPPLTSVSQPFEEIAESAVELIIGEIEGDGSNPQHNRHIFLPTYLTVRESTAMPNVPS
ncbi:LacI family DNA-binding transcriptional regulator [Alicyclobacillus mengziensis]|uniref:LacI family DNA-binding transcriptional regulator n=1 Tax=Alicyclobacillus mengziensis TaxID=2931921 RepID=A0A9X7VYL3_9BACL|nr:LacI family DNA-binding transcriptional regulator [Alicyclobacillus mengziensis]QSO47488.1 LacI family DNA-binding transcriptional regulator [Alicyclobacillus mengziensis]